VVVVQVTTRQVWAELERRVFAVVGMVSARGEARTVGIMPIVRERAIWFASMDGEWKVKHVRAHPQVSVTYPVQRNVPLLPMIKIPAATVTFQGTATVIGAPDIPPDVWRALTHGLELPGEDSPHVVVRIEPTGDFLTYGIGTSLMGMRDTTNARGRAPVA
jgi:hypothetical protein